MQQGAAQGAREGAVTCTRLSAGVRLMVLKMRTARRLLRLWSGDSRSSTMLSTTCAPVAKALARGGGVDGTEREQ